MEESTSSFFIKDQGTCLILHEHDDDDDDDNDDDDDKNLLRSWTGVVPCGRADRPIDRHGEAK
jgi:hypothetical protein